VWRRNNSRIVTTTILIL